MLWGAGFADVNALFGADECAGWKGTEEGVTEVKRADLEAGFDGGLGSGQAATGLFGRKPGADCGFGWGIAGAVAEAGHAWEERTGVWGIEAGPGADQGNGSGDVVEGGVGVGGVVEGEDAEVQVGTEVQAWTVFWEVSAGCAATVGL